MDRLNQSDAVVYCIYHDIDVMVAFHKEKGDLLVKVGHHFNRLDNTSIFYLEDDTLSDKYIFKKMKFSDYFNLLKKRHHRFFGYANSDLTRYRFCLDAYKAYTKPEFDKAVKIHPELIEKYKFLFE